MPYEADGLASLSLAVGVAVVLLWAALWALRRMRPNGSAGRNADCKIVRVLGLGPRERLVVVSIGSKQLVIGVGGTSISLLCELDAPLSPVTPVNSAFGDAVRKARERWHRD